MAFRIPDSQHKALSHLLELTEKSWSAFHSAVRRTSAELHPREYARKVADDLGDGFIENPAQAIRVLTNLLNTNDRLYANSPEEFFTDLQTAVVDTKVEHTEDNWAVFSKNIRELVDNPSSLSLTAKVGSLAAEHERTYYDARIVTDLRPVFSSSIDDSPTAMLVVHKLKLEVHELPRHSEIHIAMDHEDLVELRRLITRALEKEKSLKSLLEKAEILGIGFEDDEENE